MKRKVNKQLDLKNNNIKFSKESSGLSFKNNLSNLDNEDKISETTESINSKKTNDKISINRSRSKNPRNQSKSKTKLEFPKNGLMEDIKDSEFNRILSSILSIPKTSQANININKPQPFTKYDYFSYDNTIHNKIEMEVTIDKIQDIEVEEEKCIINRYIQAFHNFFRKSPFNYYEFSNPKSKFTYINSSIDNINYDFMILRKDNSLEREIKYRKEIKELNYISAFSSLFKKFIRGEVMNDKYEYYSEHNPDNFFYIVTPLVCFYFFKYEQNEFWEQSLNDIDNSGAIISNSTKNLERLLKENGIKFEKLEVKSESKKKQNTMDLYSIPNNANERDFQHILNNEDTSHNCEELIYVKNHYITLLFNMILNEYQDSSINVYAPYFYDCSTMHSCKYTIESFRKPDSYVIKIVIHGCIFDFHLQKLITFLQYNKDTEGAQEDHDFFADIAESDFQFRVKLTPFMKTANFFRINKKLSGPIDICEFKDNKFHLKFLNNY